MDEYHRVTQDELVAKMKETWGSWQLWAPMYNHRKTCVRYLRDEVYKRLDDPTMTRGRMKRELDAIFERVEGFGP